ncbi:MAG TPA: hypothetical protein VK478_07015 [Gemmatimonadaceae bacterium]|nr:hypothetical protein [Gemmatimonadaceae bacterium]
MTEPTLRVHPWLRPPLSPEERALEIEQTEKELRKQTRSLYLRYGFEYAVWFIAGLFLLFWSMHTTDTRYAGLAFWGGMGLGDGGMLWTLVRARSEAERIGLT